MRNWIVVGLVLAECGALAAALPAPRLERGDELHYRGEVVEAGERAGRRFRKAHDLEVRLLVLDAGPGRADCALLTRIHPRLDDIVMGPVAVATGGELTRPAAAVRVDYIRVDYRGRVQLLQPPAGPPPLPTGLGVPTQPLPPPLEDGLPLTEAGMFVPLPANEVGATAAPTHWVTVTAGRPPVHWHLTGDTTWNGGRCVAVSRVQETPHYGRPADAVSGWRRTDTLAVSVTDGLVGTLRRRTDRRHGGEVVGWVTVELERQPASRATGGRAIQARREAELAVAAGLEFEACVRNRAGFAAAGARLDRAASEIPPGAFQEGLVALRRRFAAAETGGTPPPLPGAVVVPVPKLGQPAPDFLAPRRAEPAVRLSQWRGQPVVLGFYRPGTRTAPDTLATLEAVATAHPDAVVVALAVYELPSEVKPAGRVIAADGVEAQVLFGVVNTPHFVVINPAGFLNWTFTGAGSEVETLLGGQVVRARNR